MKSLTDSLACKSRLHCEVCRTDEVQRCRIGWPQICPEGFTPDNLPEVPNRPAVPPAAPPFVAARLAVCRRCQHSDCSIRSLPCAARGTQLADPAWYCPHGRWEHLKAAMIDYLLTGRWDPELIGDTP